MRDNCPDLICFVPGSLGLPSIGGTRPLKVVRVGAGWNLTIPAGQLLCCHMPLSHENSFDPHGSSQKYLLWWFSIPSCVSKPWEIKILPTNRHNHDKNLNCLDTETRASCPTPHSHTQEENLSWRIKDSTVMCPKFNLNWLGVWRATRLPDNNLHSLLYSLSNNSWASESWLIQLSS